MNVIRLDTERCADDLRADSTARFRVAMPHRSHSVTSSRFERRLSGGRHDAVFKSIFGPYPDGPAARYFKVSRMRAWRWRHDRSSLPEWVSKILAELLQAKIREAHEAQQEFRYFLLEPPKPPRKLTGCCANFTRKSEIPRLW